jgi:nucleotide-binding universal stress UspA family protein
VIHLRSRAGRRILLLALLAPAAAGCGGQHPAAAPARPIESDQFIEVYLELRRAAAATDSAPAFEDRKDEILGRHGITGQELLDYIERNSADLGKLTAVWDTIYQRLGRRDTIPEN